MNNPAQFAEQIASGPESGLVEMLTTGVFVTAVFGSVLFALAVVLLIACCWQTMAEARERDQVKNRLRREATVSAVDEAPPEGAQVSDVEFFAPAGHAGRSWTFNVRHWSIVVSIDRIEKPA